MMEQMPADNEPYPNARNAVALMNRPDAEWCWAIYRSNGTTLEELVILFARIAADQPWAEETKTDDFRRYVAAKLGMM